MKTEQASAGSTGGNRISTADEKIAALKAENARLREAYIGDNHHIIDLQEVRKKLEAENAELKAAATENGRMLMHVELAAKRAHISELKAENKTLKARAEEAERWLAEERRSVNEMAEHVESANARADAAEKERDEANEALENIVEIAPDDLLATMLARAESAEAEAARLREALRKAEAWMTGDDGPVCRLFEDGDICDYDENPLSWKETLEQLRDLNIPADRLGYGTEWPAVTAYREIYAALQEGSGSVAPIPIGSDRLNAATLAVLDEMAPTWSKNNRVHVQCAKQIAEAVLRTATPTAADDKEREHAS